MAWRNSPTATNPARLSANLAWLAAQFGAEVKLPERPAAVIVIDAAGGEVGR